MEEIHVEQACLGQNPHAYALRLPQVLYRKLTAFSKLHRQSVNLIINQAVIDFLERKNEKSPQSNHSI